MIEPTPPASQLDDDPDIADPVELVEVDDPGVEPPASWRDDAHDPGDRAAGVDVQWPEPPADVLGMAMPTSGAVINGFTVPGRDDRAAIGVKTYTVPGTAVRLPVRSEIAPLLIGAAADWHRHVEPLDPAQCWGYAWRPVIGGTTPSFHAAGIAIDCNAVRHPLATDPARTLSRPQIDAVHAIARKYGLRWGGDYSGRKDAMHLEVILTRDAALDLVRRLQSPAPVRRPTPAPPAGSPTTGYALGFRTLRQGMQGTDVAYVQRFIGPRRCGPADGIYGPRTTAGVRWYQAMRHIAVDGVVGRATWHQMGH